MRATLIHNPSAGHAAPSRKRLAALLRDAGYDVCVPRSRKGPRLSAALREADGIVVVAGGDGSLAHTVRALGSRPAEAPPLPLAVLPLGTANNVARGLGLSGDVEALIAALPEARTVRLDAVLATWGGTSAMVLEAAGSGFFPQVMRTAQARERADGRHLEDEADELRRDVRLWCAALLEAEPHPCELTVDGADHSGDFLLTAVQNTRTYGPRIGLAPDADPSDGWLHVAAVPVDARPALAAYLAALLDGEAAPPVLPVYRGRRVRLCPGGGPLHLDDRILPSGWKPGRSGASPVDLEVVPGALTLLVPSSR